MSPLIRKELRLIMPAWLLAMLLAVLPVWAFWPGDQVFVPQSPGALVFIPFGLGVLLLGITPFGSELSLGTFSALLAQPASRRRLWLAKITVVALALGVAFVALCVSNHLRVDSVLETMKSTAWQNAFRRPGQPDKFFLNLMADIRHANLRETLVIGGVSALAAFAGGLWTTLLFRQTSAAFWLTFLVPMALGLLTAKLLGGFSSAVVDLGLLVVLGLYTAAGGFWAWRLFVRVQDLQWTGGVVALPSWRPKTEAVEPVSEHRRRPLSALLLNEIQSQYINLLIAMGLFVLHVAVLLLRKFNADYLSAHISWAMILESFPLLWLILPLLVGSVAIAEERKLGTLPNLLCLPTTRRFQFAVKLGVTLGLGVLLGAVLPFALEGVAAVRGVSGSPTALWVFHESRSIPCLLLFGSVGLSVLTFFGSTLTRNTLQALGAGVLVSVLAFLLMAFAARPPDLGDVILWRGMLIGFIGLPVVGGTVLGLAYGNYKRLQPDLHTWLRNALILLVALLGVSSVTTLVYHRAWEAWLPPEPTHRFFSSYYSNRKNHFAASAKVQATISQMALLLPDGRIWLRQRPVQIRHLVAQGRPVSFPEPTGSWHARMLSGSDWRDLAASEMKCFALQADGTLWDVLPKGTESSDVTPRQVEGNRDWKSISAGREHFTALKTDGTLWQWGDIRKSGTNVVHLALPTRVGTESDWLVASGDEGLSVAVKKDGSIWRWGRFYSGSDNPSNRWAIVEQPQKWLEGPKLSPTSISLAANAIAIVYEDGTLWLGGDLQARMGALLSTEKRALAGREMVRWAEDAEWKEVHLYLWGQAVGLKQEGALWAWNTFGTGWPNLTWLAARSRVSEYSDWLTVCWDRQAFLAFAGDGSLCMWGNPYGERRNAYSNPDSEQLLLPSRIKARRIDRIPW